MLNDNPHHHQVPAYVQRCSESFHHWTIPSVGQMGGLAESPSCHREYLLLRSVGTRRTLPIQPLIFGRVIPAAADTGDIQLPTHLVPRMAPGIPSAWWQSMPDSDFQVSELSRSTGHRSALAALSAPSTASSSPHARPMAAHRRPRAGDSPAQAGPRRRPLLAKT
jgi:hypothetical protein